MARLLLGQHPHGPLGLFISKPGIAVEDTSPNDGNNLIFSSQWGNITNIIQGGTCGLNETVTLPWYGYRPYVHIEEQVGQSYNYGTRTGITVQTGVGETRRYDYTRYNIVYLSDNQFQVRPRFPGIDGGDANQRFRYLALNFAVNQ